MKRAETHIVLSVDVSRSVLVISHERSPRTEHLVAPTDTVSAHFAALSVGIEGALRARYLHTAGWLLLRSGLLYFEVTVLGGVVEGSPAQCCPVAGSTGRAVLKGERACCTQ